MTGTTRTPLEALQVKGLDQAAVVAWSEALGDPAWLRARRLAAFSEYEKLEPPTSRDEAWRFTDPKLAGLQRSHVIARTDGSAGAAGAGVLTRAVRQSAAASPAARAAAEDDGWRAAGADLELGGLATTVDGALATTDLARDLAEQGVVLTDLATAAREHAELVEPRFMTLARPDEHTFLALHGALVSTGTFLYVPRGVQVTLPLGVLQQRTAPGATFAHTLVVVEDGAQVTLLHQHGSPEVVGGHAFHHGVTELFLGRDAEVQHLSLQEWASDSVVHFNAVRAEVGPEARYRSMVVTLGGKVVRFEPETWLRDRADATFLGAVFADEGQHFEHRATTHHVGANARSDLLYKAGLLAGARNVFFGNVIVHPSGRGTDAGQEMRNLVLSRGASAEAIPFLEIKTSDVAKCTHAAATGRVDDEHLFYLESRGIPRHQARRLVVFGFFDEILQQVTIPAVRQRLQAALEDELAKEVEA